MFAIGIWFCQQLANLPAPGSLGVGLLACVASLALAWRLPSRKWRLALVIPAVLCLGFIWAAAWGQWRLADFLAEADEGRDIRVVGVVSGLPQDIERGRRFDFEVEKAEGSHVPRHISLAWYRGRQELVNDETNVWQEVHAGERWALTVRLKKPHGNLNPHGFDFEAWLFERGVRATGYVRTTSLEVPNTRLTDFVPGLGTVVERMRESVRDRFRQALPEGEYAGVLVALAVGDQQAIDSGLWLLFARTGITHLMSISGLHVTMVAAMGWWLVWLLWRREPSMALRIPAQKAAALGGVLFALAYTLLAGFGVPAQRTLYMVGVVAVALLQKTILSEKQSR